MGHIVGEWEINSRVAPVSAKEFAHVIALSSAAEGQGTANCRWSEDENFVASGMIQVPRARRKTRWKGISISRCKDQRHDGVWMGEGWSCLPQDGKVFDIGL